MNVVGSNKAVMFVGVVFDEVVVCQMAFAVHPVRDLELALLLDPVFEAINTLMPRSVLRRLAWFGQPRRGRGVRFGERIPWYLSHRKKLCLPMYPTRSTWP